MKRRAGSVAWLNIVGLWLGLAGLASAQTPVVTVKSVLGSVGQTVDLPVEYAPGSAAGVAVQLELQHDGSRATAGTPTLQTGSAQPLFVGNAEPGITRLLLGNALDLTALPARSLARIPYTLTAGGSKPIAATALLVSDATPNPVPAAAKGGVIADPRDGLTDTDGDGIPDAWEVANGLDPMNPDDAIGDSDGDGISNLDEYLNSTSPQQVGNDRVLPNYVYQWTQTFAADIAMTPIDVAVARDGAVYVLAGYEGVTDFDPGVDRVDAVDAFVDIALIRFNPNGSYAWSRHLKSNAWLMPGGVAVDSQGNPYISGSLTGVVDFAGFVEVDASYVEPGLLFYARINSDGSRGWEHFIGPGFARDVGVDDNDNVYVAGYFAGTMDFAHIHDGSDMRSAGPGGSQWYTAIGAFLTSRMASGTYRWTRTAAPAAGSQGSVDLRAISVRGDSALVALSASGANLAWDVGAGSAPVSSGVSLVAFDTGWTGLEGSASVTPPAGKQLVPRSLAQDVNGNLYLAGAVYATASNYDAYLAQFDAQRVEQWTRTFGGSKHEVLTGVATGADGRIYVSGTADGAVDFAPADAQLGQRALSTGPGAFVLAYDGTGQYQGSWLTAATRDTTAPDSCTTSGYNYQPYTIGGCVDANTAYSGALGIGANGDIYAVGGFAGAVNFNPDGAADNKQGRKGSDGIADLNGFVTKLARVKRANTAPVVRNANIYVSQSTTVSGNIDVYDADYDPVTTTQLTSPPYGILTFTASSGNYRYQTPAVSGPQTFNVKISDGEIESTVTVTFWVTSPTDSDGDGMPDARETQYFGDLSRDGSLDADLDGLIDRAEAAADTHPLIANNGKTIPQHDYVWTRTFGDGNYQYALSVAMDRQSNAYLAGYYQGNVDFDPTAGADLRTSIGGDNLFVTRINADGSYGWTWTATLQGTVGASVARGIAVDNQGYVYVAGAAQGQVRFDPAANGTVKDLTASSAGSIFLTKLRTNGSYVSTATIGGNNAYAQAWGLALAPDRSVYVTGHFAGTATFDPTGSEGPRSAGEVIANGNGTYSYRYAVFVTRFNGDGSYAWTRFAQATTGDNGYAYGVAADNANVYVTGEFYGTFDFDGVSGNGDDLTRSYSGGGDGFVAQWNSSGTLVKSLQLRGTVDFAGTVSRAIAIDRQGGLYVAGGFLNAVDFDPSAAVAARNPQQSPAEYHAFVLKLDASGGLAWVNTFGNTVGSSYSSVARALALSGDSVYVGGYFSGTTDIDPTSGTDTRSSRAARAQFVTELSSDGSYVGAWTPVGADGVYCCTPPYIDNGGWVTGLAAGHGRLYAAGYMVGSLNFNPTGIADVRNSAAGPTGSASDDVFVTALTTPLPPNAAPVAVDATLDGTVNVALDGQLSASDADGNSLTYRIVSQPSSGTVEPFDAATGAFRYTPAPDVVGTLTFTFVANDGSADSAPATVTLRLYPVGDADKDWIPDSWEILYFGDTSIDGTADTDGDGAADVNEYAAGSDPRVNDTSVATNASFQQSTQADGLVVIEAETYHAQWLRNGKVWSPLTSAGASGGSALQVTPNDNVTRDTGYLTNSSRLDYQVNFVKTGVHQVWIRGLAPTDTDDTLHVGLDGAAVTSADRVLFKALGVDSWTKDTMDGPVATINVTTLGVHTINVWMRDDGVQFDKLLLTTDTGYVPQGNGPAPSVLGTAAGGAGSGASGLAPVAVSNGPAPAQGMAGELQSSGAGLIVVEAEHYSTHTLGVSQTGTPPYWDVIDVAGASSGRAVQINPDQNVSVDLETAGTARLDYRVQFPAAGTYYIWVRGRAAGDGADSVNIGLDETLVAGKLSNFGRAAAFQTWYWSGRDMNGAVLSMNVPSAGVHTVNVWMREDGFIFDKLILNTNSAYRPHGYGVAEGAFAVTNTAPAANNATLNVVAGSAVTGTLSATDSQNDALTYSIVAGPALGNVVITNPATGAFTYTANGGVSGADTFTFKANDGTADSNIATVTVNVSLSVAAMPTLSPAGGSFTGSVSISLATTASGASIYYTLDGSTPSVASNLYTGVLTLTQSATLRAIAVAVGYQDSAVASGDYTVTVPVNQPPTAGNTTLSTPKGMAVMGQMQASDADGDALTYTIVDAPTHSQAFEYGSSSGDFTYTPAATFTGTDSFTFKVNDGKANSALATVSIEVMPTAASVPVASDAALDTTANTVVDGQLMASDADGDALTYRLVSQPSDGTVELLDAATGSFRYTPGLDVVGTVTFSFVANDGTADSAPATVTLNLYPVGDADKDWMPDSWETFYFGDTSRDGRADADGDGVSDVDEYVAGSNPTLNESGLALNASVQQSTQADGLVVIEAEHYDAQWLRNGKAWTPVTPLWASGGVALEIGANSGVTRDTGYLTNSSRLDYQVNFVKTGVHQVWIHGLAASDTDDTLHVGLDGATVSTADRVLFTTLGSEMWTKATMDGPVATINVTTLGVHTINVWMRDDGVLFDKLLLTTSSGYVPQGAGPKQSVKGIAAGGAGGGASTLVPMAVSNGPAPTQGVTGVAQSKSASLIVIEAEHYATHTQGTMPTGEAKYWEVVDVPGASSGRAMQINQELGHNVDLETAATARLDYQVQFPAAGTYYVWVRGRAADDGADSVNVGLDETLTSAKLGQFGIGGNLAASFNTWYWSGRDMSAAVMSMSVPSAGVHTVNVWMREDGFIFDKLILSTDSAYRPQGFGVAEGAFAAP